MPSKVNKTWETRELRFPMDINRYYILVDKEYYLNASDAQGAYFNADDLKLVNLLSKNPFHFDELCDGSDDGYVCGAKNGLIIFDEENITCARDMYSNDLLRCFKEVSFKTDIEKDIDLNKALYTAREAMGWIDGFPPIGSECIWLKTGQVVTCVGRDGDKVIIKSGDNYTTTDVSNVDITRDDAFRDKYIEMVTEACHNLFFSSLRVDFNRISESERCAYKLFVKNILKSAPQILNELNKE